MYVMGILTVNLSPSSQLVDLENFISPKRFSAWLENAYGSSLARTPVNDSMLTDCTQNSLAVFASKQPRICIILKSGEERLLHLIYHI